MQSCLVLLNLHVNLKADRGCSSEATFRLPVPSYSSAQATKPVQRQWPTIHTYQFPPVKSPITTDQTTSARHLSGPDLNQWYTSSSAFHITADGGREKCIPFSCKDLQRLHSPQRNRTALFSSSNPIYIYTFLFLFFNLEAELITSTEKHS